MSETKRFPSSTSLRVIGLTGFLLATSAIADPTEPPPPLLDEASPSGLRAYVDPETGELTSTPSAAQVELLNQALELSSSRSSEGLEPFELRLGGTGVFLGARFQSALIVHWSEHGARGFRCVEGQHEQGSGQPLRSEAEWVEK